MTIDRNRALALGAVSAPVLVATLTAGLLAGPGPRVDTAPAAGEGRPAGSPSLLPGSARAAPAPAPALAPAPTPAAAAPRHPAPAARDRARAVTGQRTRPRAAPLASAALRPTAGPATAPAPRPVDEGAISAATAVLRDVAGGTPVAGPVTRHGDVPVEEAPAPRLEDLAWSPDVPVQEGWLRLPAGPGELTVSVRAEHADRVSLVVTPTGTETAPHAEEVALSRGDDGRWSGTWRYGAPVLSHLGLTAEGPGGRTAVDLPHAYAE